jgi:amino acid transporter
MRIAQITVNTGFNTHGTIVRAGLWSALAFILNLPWEVAHVRLYTIWPASDAAGITWALLHCTVGDALIALAMFALTGIVLRRADWPMPRPWTGGVIVVIGAIAFTVWSEWYNVYRAGNWGYTASMPMIFGIGVSPLLQWLILPLAMVRIYRKLAPGLFRRRSAPRPIPTYDAEVPVDS